MSIADATPDLKKLPKAKVLRNQLEHYESTPALLLRWAALDWMIIALAWTVMAGVDSWLIRIAGIFVVASRLQALGALLHDACHSRVRSRVWVIVEAVAGWPIASTIAAMRYHHLRHHRYSGTQLDPYRNSWIERGPLARAILVLRGMLLPLWWTLRAVTAPFAALASTIRTFYARAFLQDRAPDDPAQSDEVRACIRSDLRQLIAQVAALSLALTFDLPIIEFYLIPWVLAGVCNAHRVLYEHAFAKNIDSSRQRVYASTNDHEVGFLMRSTLFPHNLGLHRAHHLYPTASFVHLPKLTTEVRSALEQQQSL